MQQFGSASSLYDQDTAVYTVGRSSTEALIGMDQETGSLMMGWDDDDDNDDDNDLARLGRQPKLPADVITTELHHNNNHNHNHHHHNHNNHQHSHGLHDLELEDNTQLLQDMLQQDQTTCNNIINLPVSTTVSHHAAVGGESEQQQQYCSSTAAAWEESIHVLQEMLLLQQHQQSIPPSQEHLIFSTGFNNMGYPMGNNNNTINSALSQIPFNPDSSNTAKFPGESELLSLLQLPRCASSSLPPGSSIQSSVSSKKALGGIIPPNYTNNPIDLGDNSNNNPSSLYMDSHLMQPAAAGYSLSFRNLVHNLPLTNAANYKLGTGQNDQIEKDHAAVFSGSILGEGGHVSAPIFDFKRDGGLQQQQKVGEPRVINHFATERQRREYLNEKYQTLRSLVPNPTKSDRASIVQDAIEYVKELKRTVQELQLLVQEKRRGKYGKISNNGGGNGHLLMRKRKLEGGGTGNSNGDQAVQESGGSSSQCRGGEGGDHIMLISDDILANDTTGLGCQLRSSWLQRSSQNGTQVDVRIVDDEVNIKLSLKKQHHHHHHHLLHHHPPPPPPPPPPPQQQQQQQQQQQANTRRISSLLNVVVMLQELHLDILHANGASIGEHHIFMFNTKIMEGSSTYAGQIAAKLIEAVDRNISSQLILC